MPSEPDLLAAFAAGPRLPTDAEEATRAFHRWLRREVVEGNPGLTERQQRRLQSHYPVLMAAERFPPALVTAIYVERRAPAVAAIAADRAPQVLDAGCGYGSESFLFAAAGAEVLAVDRSAEQIAISRLRQRYFEQALGRRLAIEFVTADLDAFTPDRDDLSLTWLASVLAAVGDQEALLRRVRDATRPGGEVMVTDMNLLNPLFLVQEWRRRRRLSARSAEFARRASYLDMLRRRGRRGARYFSDPAGGVVDDVQFFRPGTLARLLRRTGFSPAPATFSGFVPPRPASVDHRRLERLLARVPVLRRFGYFYLMAGHKPRQRLDLEGR